MGQFTGSGHRWSVATEITPLTDGGRPAYLVSYFSLPAIPKTNVSNEFSGGFLLGEGRYHVRWLLADDQQRVCRKEWNLNARLEFSERHVKPAMAPDTVAALSTPASIPADDVPPLRLTLLVDAAPLFTRRSKMQASDQMMILSAVASLLQRVPGKESIPAVRLVAFNLDQQKEILRRDNFALPDLFDLQRAINGLNLASVDYHLLANRRGHLDLLANLVNHELNAAGPDGRPADAVVFIGPRARYYDKVPPDAIARSATAAPRFFYFQFRPMRPVLTPVLPDSINFLVAALKGRTFIIHTPSDFNKAIDQLERLSPTETAAR